MPQKDRCFIYAKDIMTISGRSKTYAYSILKKVKVFFNKPEHQMVTVEEYASFHGIPLDVLKKYLT
ncbi:hypothetical protein [Belliella aquatica]|uniref:Uncharacterized protein n=1 Tax=Belliella aquatica TaxID=1323734 RepID=A0ABQ1N5V4_9BACT|nr:hypothetical protein [Belliella aquatica]MCH7407649.1 hypothetical protein [Belliella aquatica]GGC55215.1 hypothetical protein GCM10010993_36910 [Belliella aquatica]